MASFYEPGNIKIGKLVDDASDSTGAKILIPNLQRLFVWKPGDVTLLVDSLIRGWPFGSLLFWAVDPATFDIAKSAEPAYDFFAKVHDFRNGKITFVEFVRSMRIKGSLLRLSGRCKQQLSLFIRKREDLIKYVDGVLQRVDL